MTTKRNNKGTTKQVPCMQEVFKHNTQNNDQWLLQSGFKIPLLHGLDWTKSTDNPYKVDMSRYFTNIVEELDKWLMKDTMFRMPTETAESRLQEGFEDDEDHDQSPTTKKNVGDFHWLVEENANINPMASYLKMNSDLSKWKKTKASLPI